MSTLDNRQGYGGSVDISRPPENDYQLPVRNPARTPEQSSYHQ